MGIAFLDARSSSPASSPLAVPSSSTSPTGSGSETVAVPVPDVPAADPVPRRCGGRRCGTGCCFALRCLASCSSSLAFARPFLGARERRPPPRRAGRATRVVLLDRSYSMGYGDRWARARGARRAGARGAAAAGPGQPRPLRRPRRGDRRADRRHARLRSRRSTPQRVGFGVTRYAPALRWPRRSSTASPAAAARGGARSPTSRRAGWDGRDDVRLPAGHDAEPGRRLRARRGERRRHRRRARARLRGRPRAGRRPRRAS